MAGHIPFLHNRLDGRHIFRRNYQQHSLLGLGEHHLVRAHALLPLVHLGQIKADSPASASRRLNRRAGQTCSTQVLNRIDQTSAQRFQAGFNQDFF